MAQVSITPGGGVSDISANSVYNIPSQLAGGNNGTVGGRAIPPADVRSGVDPIVQATLYDSAIQTMSALSAATLSAATSFGANGLIGFVDEYSIRVGSAANITSVMELVLQYQAVGEGQRKL